ncbi:DUF5719 family protein [Isoptericola chiayiensis]|uniref:DUF5719 family protein n=1 Tax=Isoptericola chiayiensis TaxID=579446 RepID=A0ABP8Y438_9MICO|nr:DUF5719 family protein [Isoptericola chiayiensis]NOV99336.1 hypothetical protein [Isoptericola chiayiensis]
MSRAAQWGRTAAVVATGIVVAGGLAATAAVGQDWVDRWTGAEQSAVAAGTREVPVDPSETHLVCPRPVSLPQGADVGDDQFSASQDVASGLAAVVLGADGAETRGLGGGREAELTGGADADVLTTPVERPRVLSAMPQGSALRAAAATGSVTTAGDLRGLAAASCQEPATEHWLVGGDSEVGSSALLVVQNPSARPAAVAVQVYGPNGPVAVGGQGEFTVAAGEQEVVRLDSLAPEQRRLAVHVAASGTRVTATMQIQAIDGLVPAGVDLVEAGAAPGDVVAVDGVVSRGEELEDDHAPVLWLLNPGDRSGTARLTVLGPDGPVTLRGAEQVELAAGAVTAVPVGGLPAGTYTVRVDADVSVAAAARVSVPGEQPEDSVVDGTPHDVAWSAGQVLPDPGAPVAAQVALPPTAAGATVALTAVPPAGADDVTGELTATVRGVDAAGDVAGEQAVTVPVGSTVEVPVADFGAEVGVLVDTDGDREGSAVLTWSVRLRADDGTGADGTLVATLDPTATSASAGSVSVRRVDVP